LYRPIHPFTLHWRHKSLECPQDAP
jgi:hypothetical protein